MQGSTTEIEVKLRFETAESAREALQRLGPRLRRPREFEDNIVFDRQSGSLVRAGRVLRLRRAGDRAILTLKSPTGRDDRYKIREEHETTVGDADAANEVLRGLGFAPVYRYQKYRTVYSLDDLTICLDETPLGCFVELEGPPAAIDRTAETLGFEPDEYVRESYRELQLQDAQRRGVEPGDLIMERDRQGAP